MSKYDYKREGVEHLERPGCIINIRAELRDRGGHEVTHIEILPDSEWAFDGCINNRIVKEEVD